MSNETKHTPEATISKVNRLLDVAERARKAGITPSSVLGFNPTLAEVTEQDLTKLDAAIRTAEGR